MGSLPFLSLYFNGFIFSAFSDIDYQSVIFLRGRMLSMYASVTNIIPDLDDHSKISGHTVYRDNKAAEKFEFVPTKISSFEICKSTWEMINKQQMFGYLQLACVILPGFNASFCNILGHLFYEITAHGVELY
ncbi:hypothetical protein NC653_029698 [Populus alba x Populus x berolinensis]|uniref:Uncharacterized protein n=1 Tax=Populus alba x Populus x berolinensis TaxID=444605 RepID=A0AAD6M2P4_9ROSI|nr:hypothetical protein NC653_029698 [Populus alba x Populus x berolinensis]